MTLWFEHELAASHRLAGLGGRVQVLSPPSVRDALVATAREILTRYDAAKLIPIGTHAPQLVRQRPVTLPFRPASPGKTMRDIYTYTSPDDPGRQDDGLFGPGSVTWRLTHSRIMWVAAVRALLLQALHPRVIRGTLQNATAVTEPVEAWARLRRTREFVETCTYGTVAEAERAGRRVRRIHESLKRRRAGLIGLDPGTAPASMAELDAYYEQIRPRLYACDEAKEAQRLLFHPPVPEGNRTLNLALPPFNALAFSTLPGWARRMYGRSGGPLTDIAATAGQVVRQLGDREHVHQVEEQLDVRDPLQAGAVPEQPRHRGADGRRRIRGVRFGQVAHPGIITRRSARARGGSRGTGRRAA
jgi:uncharacterized protein (DUF2236 family)